MSTEAATPEVHHAAAAGVVAITELLAAYGGWMDTRDIAERLGLQKDTAHRMLRQLTESGWVQRQSAPGGDRWALGLHLYQLALGHHERLVGRARSLRAEFDALLNPLKS